MFRSLEDRGSFDEFTHATLVVVSRQIVASPCRSNSSSPTSSSPSEYEDESRLLRVSWTLLPRHPPPGD